ncbi:MAG TPA: hypothetical protein VHN79_06780, partial [Lacunisphaera sp.]|nr:hypothetical protein [Lacunisphaera sp.]
WPSEFGRYLMPGVSVAVLGLLFALREATLVARNHWPRKQRFLGIVPAVVVGLLLLVQLRSARGMFQGSGHPSGPLAAAPTWFYYDATWQRWERALGWIRDRASPETVVATTASHFCHLRTGLLSVMPPMEPDPAKLIRLLDSVPVSFVVIDEMEFRDTARRYVQSVVAARPAEWKLVREEANTRVYQRLRTVEGAGRESSPR